MPNDDQGFLAGGSESLVGGGGARGGGRRSNRGGDRPGWHRSDRTPHYAEPVEQIDFDSKRERELSLFLQLITLYNISSHTVKHLFSHRITSLLTLYNISSHTV